MATIERPNVRRELLRLKNFQRDTVEHVFEAMYGPNSSTRRFLVADEVGLGKTMVARGVVAKVVDHLWDDIQRIDIVYICSNGSIARQNINRLNLCEAREAALPSRITLLPKFTHGLSQRKLNFVSLTPQTSFSLRSNQGTAEERALLFWLLPEDWKQPNVGAMNALQGGVQRERFRDRLRYSRHDAVDEGLREQFRAHLNANGELRTKFGQLCEAFHYSREWSRPERQLQSEVVGALRLALAESCLRALEPDLIILDEFQRFKELLDGTDPSGELARRLFTTGDTRVLMLSATPYKMFTASEDGGEEDHYRDFLQTVGFLQEDAERTNAFKSALSSYRREMFRLDGGQQQALLQQKALVEQQLRQIMVRTERLAATADRNGMLEHVPTRVRLEASDVTAYLQLSRMTAAVHENEIVEYWKSAPYLLNFMDDAYRLKERVRKAANGSEPGLRAAASQSGQALLSRSDVDKYAKLDPPNARIRHITEEYLDSGVWKLLWMPASMPYYRHSEAYRETEGRSVTKRLMFSSWQIVPKVVAALLSHDVERRVFTEASGDLVPRPSEVSQRFAPRLQFSRADGRPAGMSALGLMYPSITLAEVGDPLSFVRGDAASLPDSDAVVGAVEQAIERLLADAGLAQEAEGPRDEAWYWAAPILLDRHRHPDAADRWFSQDGLAGAWRGDGEEDNDEAPEADESADGWAVHVERARTVSAGTLGAPPADLAAVLALVAIGGPAVAALRALSRISGGSDVLSHATIRNKAGWIAWGFRSLFNLPEVIALIEAGSGSEPYWQRVITYGVARNLQAVLDEYAHVLLEQEGLAHRSVIEGARGVAKRMRQILRLRTANVRVDDLNATGDAVAIDEYRMRARFAVRFGARQADEGAGAVRDDDVRAAFNSPFWPFVLCSTSVGQEGLDFHPYCHAVVHWNLPSNPVDLEQREGRVHRYKNHAVRKNAAAAYGQEALSSDGADPWTSVFQFAQADPSRGESDLRPFWVLPGAASIERHVPALPLSRDERQAERVREAVTVYRMAFGQARQQDLLDYLTRTFSAEQIESVAAALRIDLSPRGSVGLEDAVGDDELVARAPLSADVALRAGRTHMANAAGLAALLDSYAQLSDREQRDNLVHLTALLDAFAARGLHALESR